MKRRPTRRDFLQGAVGEGPRAGQAAPADTARTGAGCLVRLSRRAMACEFEICLPADQYGRGAETALEALDLVEHLESQLSVFRAESEISRINRTAAERPVEVEPRLFALLELAMRLCGETGGAYDITAGPLWEVWGFARRAAAIPAAGQLAEARQRVGGHLVELDSPRRTVRFLRPGVQLNLGSIGKGYAVDCCAGRLLEGGLSDFLIHGGHSSILARGAGTPAAQAAGWLVGLRDPVRPDRRVGQLRLADRALGTSGAQFQSFRHQGRRYGHLLDPRTGWPAEGVLSATALAPNAAWADGLSTALYVLGPEGARAYCREHPEVAAVLLTPAEGPDRWVLHTAGTVPDLGQPAP
ncbi:MAG: FAD:protein FMN transferase [Thermoguttaceae bacterium]|jgi:thiamine biosynthesis lipoprotein